MFPFSPPPPSLSLSLPPFVVITLLPLSGEYERVQKKAFTNWVNSHLIKVGLFSLPLVLIVVSHFTHYHSVPVESHQPYCIIFNLQLLPILTLQRPHGPWWGQCPSAHLCYVHSKQLTWLLRRHSNEFNIELWCEVPLIPRYSYLEKRTHKCGH